MTDQLLSRDDFRNGVFTRDHHKCAVCGEPAKDAHHIVERRLWPDGGYYVSNGASVCETHHLAAETTVLSCDELRKLCGIKNVILPPHLYSDAVYDKWGNEIMPNGQRLKGELFNDDSVQKIISPVLHLFTGRIKYPRTFHLPWSPGGTDDDRKMEDLSAFEGEEVIVTLKMDGEQTTMYRDGFHARSIDTPAHPSRDWLWGLYRRIGHDIPENWRICGENLYAKHSIHYTQLPAYFMMFSIWNEKNEALSWDETLEWAALLDLVPVTLIYRGPWNESFIRGIHKVSVGENDEGFVVRVTRKFHYREFRRVIAKYVRASHVHTHGHWMRDAVVPNKLKEGL